MQDEGTKSLPAVKLFYTLQLLEYLGIAAPCIGPKFLGITSRTTRRMAKWLCRVESIFVICLFVHSNSFLPGDNPFTYSSVNKMADSDADWPVSFPWPWQSLEPDAYKISALYVVI